MWRERDGLLRTVLGVGEKLSLTLLAYLPELGTLDRRQIAGPSGRGSLQPGEGAHWCGPYSIWERWWAAATTL